MTTFRRSFLVGLGLLLSVFAGASGSAEHAAREVLVLGGTGKLGAEIVRLLVQNGDHVTVLVRETSDRSRLKDQPVSYVTGDVLDDADVEAAFKGRKFGIVVTALLPPRSEIHFYDRAMPILVKHAKAAGVQQIVHQSAVGAGASLQRVDTTGWDKVPGMLDRLKDQTAGEEALRNGGVPYTIIRNARLWPDGTPATGKAELTEDDSVLTPMTRLDLARVTVSCVGNPACLNRIYHVKDESLTWPPPGGMR
jgi:uncharacterized protein YbjT (DUF2867 family)